MSPSNERIETMQGWGVGGVGGREEDRGGFQCHGMRQADISWENNQEALAVMLKGDNSGLWGKGDREKKTVMLQENQQIFSWKKMWLIVVQFTFY